MMHDTKPYNIDLQYNSYIYALAGLVFTISFCAMIGMLFKIDWLVNPYNTGITIKFNTALCYMLCAISLFIITFNSQKNNQALKIITFIINSTILLIAALTIFQHVSNTSLHIDQLFITEETPFKAEYPPGRMVLLTAYIFVLNAIVLMLIDSNNPRMKEPANTIIYCIFALIMVPLFKYLYETILINGTHINEHKQLFIEYLINMSIQAIVISLLLNVGLLLANRENTILKYLKHKSIIGDVYRVIFVCIITIPFAITLIVHDGVSKKLYDNDLSNAILVTLVIIFGLLIATLATKYLLTAVDRINDINSKLSTSEELFRSFAENIDSIFWRSTPALNQYIYISKATQTILGRSPEEFIKNPMLWMDSIVQEDRNRYLSDFINRLNDENINSAEVEYRIIDSTGGLHHIHDRCFKIKNHTDISIIGIATDVTSKWQSQQRFAAFNVITDLLNTSNDISEICREFLIITCKTQGWDLGELWLVDEKTSTLKCVDIWYSNNLDLYDFEVKGKSITLQKNVGMPGKIWHAREAVWVPDILKDKSLTRAAEASKAGLKSAFGVPIIYKGKILGVIDFSSQNDKKPDDDIIQALTSLGEQLGIYINNNLNADQLKQITHHDILTGLLNHLSFTTTINNHIESDPDTTFSIIMIDCTKVKLLSQIKGKSSGELLLKLLARRIQLFPLPDKTITARTQDHVFAIALMTAERDEITIIIQELLNQLNRPLLIHDDEITPDIRIGVARYPNDGENASTLISNADSAMDIAKKSVAHKIEFYSVETKISLAEKFIFQNHLVNAVKRNEMKLYYQPILNLKSLQLSGMEALIRWQHPSMGLLTPDRFITISESSGNIFELGEWIMKDVCRFIAEHHIKIPVSINLSVSQFDREYDLISAIKYATNYYGVPFQQLHIEITENIMITDFDHIAMVLNSLKRLGCVILLDDFGTGYSSFNYLKKFIPDIIKIDKSFTNDLTFDNNNDFVVKSIIMLAHGIGVTIIAEGVENKRQLQFLQNAHCDSIQGYYISKPLPEEAIIAFLKNKIAI